MLRDGLILLLGLFLLLRIPSVNFSEEVESSINIKISIVEQFRSRLIDHAKQLLPEYQAGLLLGMILGVKEEIPWKFNQILKKTGVVHVVVVSGQNLTLLAGFILGFSKFFGRKKTIIASLCLVSSYLFLTGFQIPVIRASIMFFLSSLAKLYGRQGDSIRILLITVLLMLIFQPLWITSISFQLSVLATVGVVILAPELIKRATFIPEILRQDILVTISAQLLTAPIIAYYFNQFSTAGLFVNLLVLWTVPFIMISGAFVLLLSLISLPIAKIFIIIPEIFLNYFIGVVEIFNKPFASSYINEFSIIQLIGVYVVISSCFILLLKNRKEPHPEGKSDPEF